MNWKAHFCAKLKILLRRNDTFILWVCVTQACSLNQESCIWLSLIVGFLRIKWQGLNGFLYFVIQLNVWIFEIFSSCQTMLFFFSCHASNLISDFNYGISAGSCLSLDVLLFLCRVPLHLPKLWYKNWLSQLFQLQWGENHAILRFWPRETPQFVYNTSLHCFFHFAQHRVYTVWLRDTLKWKCSLLCYSASRLFKFL